MATERGTTHHCHPPAPLHVAGGQRGQRTARVKAERDEGIADLGVHRDKAEWQRSEVRRITARTNDAVRCTLYAVRRPLTSVIRHPFSVICDPPCRRPRHHTRIRDGHPRLRMPHPRHALQRVGEHAFAAESVEAGGANPPGARRAGGRCHLRTGGEEGRARARQFARDAHIIPRAHVERGAA